MRRTGAQPITVSGEEWCCYYRGEGITKTEWQNAKGDKVRRNLYKSTYSAWAADGTLVGKQFRSVKNAAMSILKQRE